MTAALVCGFFLLGATVASGTLFELDMQPLGLAAMVALAAVASLTRGAPAASLLAGRPQPIWSTGAVVLGLAACAPAAFGFALSFAQEFPFAGDAAVHISLHFRTALFWVSPIGSNTAAQPAFAGAPSLAIADLVMARGLVLAACLATLAAVLRFGQHRPAFVVACAIALAWSLVDTFPFQRYPGLVYFLGVPFNLVVGAVFPAEAANGPRLAAFLALPAWLFVLRPLIVGRAPDAAAAMAAVLIHWGERQIYWQSAPYLETWAICGLMLALESLHARGRRAAAMACLCVGAAACAKEQAILFLPFAWLAGQPWRAAPPDAPMRRDLLIAGFAAGLPLVFHMLLRGAAGGRRDLGAAGFEASALLEGAMIWAARVPAYFAEAWYLPLFAVALGFVMALGRPEGRAAAFTAIGAMIAGFILYALDSFGPEGRIDTLAGYYRFSAPFLPALAVGTFALAERAGSERAALAITAVFALVQAPGAIAGVRLMAAESERRNGIEDGVGAIFVPLRALIDAAERDGVIDRTTPVIFVSPTPFVTPHPAAMRARDLRFVDHAGFQCGCSTDRPAAVVVYVFHDSAEAMRLAGVTREREFRHAPGTRAAKGEPPEAYAACRAAFEASCRYVRARIIDDVPTGVMGAGAR